MIKVGFIGTGGISAAHLNCLKTRKDVKIAALCDVNLEQARRRQREYGGEVFTDFREMLDQAPLDAVWLCTPPTVRRDPLLACARKGVPVFCEKPVERSETRAAAIAAELTRLKARTQVGYVCRSLPVVEKLRQALRDDTIHLIQSHYGCPASLDLSLPKWFYDKSKSGGALVDQATHSLDLLRYLFGEVNEVHGLAANPYRKKAPGYTIDETIGLVFRFAAGMIAVHTHSWVAESWRNEITISGEKRFYRLKLSQGRLLVEATRARLRAGKGAFVAGKGAREFEYIQPPGTGFAYENRRFLQQVTSGDWRHNPTDYGDGLKTLRLTLACDRATVNGKALLKK